MKEYQTRKEFEKKTFNDFPELFKDRKNAL